MVERYGKKRSKVGCLMELNETILQLGLARATYVEAIGAISIDACNNMVSHVKESYDRPPCVAILPLPDGDEDESHHEHSTKTQ